jgi:hypothetical protein
MNNHGEFPMKTTNLFSMVVGRSNLCGAVLLGLAVWISASAISGCDSESSVSGPDPAPESPATKSSPNRQSNSETLRHDYIVSKGKSPFEWQRAKGKWIADLRTRYKGIDVRADQSKIGSHASHFGELMREWNPILCSVDDLKSIAGKPTRETVDMLEYHFNRGITTYTWRFKIVAGTIFGVEYLPGE